MWGRRNEKQTLSTLTLLSDSYKCELVESLSFLIACLSVSCSSGHTVSVRMAEEHRIPSNSAPRHFLSYFTGSPEQTSQFSRGQGPEMPQGSLNVAESVQYKTSFLLQSAHISEVLVKKKTPQALEYIFFIQTLNFIVSTV